MATVQWDPWRELSTFERQMTDLFNRVQRQPATRAGFAPVLDAFHRNGSLVVRAELPGVRPEDVHLDFTDNMLVLRGERHQQDDVADGNWVRRERSYGGFERQIVLPEGTDPDAITASFDLGVLEVTIPHPKAVEPKKVQIQIGGSSAQTRTTEAAPAKPVAQASTSGRDVT